MSNVRPAARLLALAVFAASTALAANKPDLDAFLQQKDSRPLPSVGGQGRVEHVEQRLGVPTFVWGERQAPPGLSRSATPEQAARAHLKGRADGFRLSAKEIAEAKLISVHDRGEGAIIVRLGQLVEGREVFRNQLNVAMDREKRLVAISGYLAPAELADQARVQGAAAFRLSSNDAVANAFSDLTGVQIDGQLLTAPTQKGAYSHADLGTTVLTWRLATPARAKEVFFTLPDRLEAAYYVEVDAGLADSSDSAMYSYVISATDGRILFRRNLTEDDSYTYRVWADPTTFIPYDGPHGVDATPHPTGLTDRYQAPFIAPNLITLQSYPFSRNDAWLPPNATQTTGNNVDAYADLAGPDGFQAVSDVRATVTAPGAFDYTYDPMLPPAANATQRQAAVTSLFYLNNFLHDWFYDSGFDEAAGNAQSQNFGRGGLENDSIRAEAQDYGGRNNANMSTPADGARPRMQMYVFSGVPELTVSAPAAVAGSYEAGTSTTFGDQDFDVDAAVAIPNPNGPTEACAALPAGTFTGKIALVDRGTCGFSVKALVAQNAGAVAVLIGNNAPNQVPPGMGGADPAVTIPALSISLETANAWRTEVKNNATTITARMRRGTDLDRDGTIDNAIAAHEWGHYLSNRLVANSAGLVNNQGRAMGEGWADTVAMLMIVRPEDVTRAGNNTWQGVYAVAAYTSSGGANNGHYYGIRRVPYSTDLTKNSLTLKNIANGTPLPTTHPVAFGSPTSNSQVHNSGEVWATMLWECYASLLNAYPFQEAQDRWKSYLVSGFKLTPPSPTFLEARDALLAAAAASDPADYQRFVNAFAKRGAGFGAKVPDRASSDHYPVVESFVSGNNLEVVKIRLDDSLTGCDRDGVLDVGETGRLSVTVTNTGAGALTSFTGTVSANGATATLAFPSGNTLSFPPLARGASATASLPVQLTAVTGVTPAAGLTVNFSEPSLPVAAQTTSYDGRVHYDEQVNTSAVETGEGSLFVWSSTTVSGNPLWKAAGLSGQRYFHADNQSSVSDVVLTSPWLQVNPTGNFTFSFRHRYSFESTNGAAPFYDGGVVEISRDGVNWMDPALMGWSNPGYLVLATTPPSFATLAEGDSPLSGRPAFMGANTGFPNFVTPAATNLGTRFAGERIQVRFRLGTDSGVGAYGWDIDTVTFNNVATAPFATLAAETSDGSTCNQLPVADAGRPQTVNERSLVTLDGSASFDPDGQAITYAWVQVGGPTVTLNNPTTAAPTFTADGISGSTVFSFQLTVNDGVDTSIPRNVDVGVLNQNRLPIAVATASPASPIVERSVPTVTLDGSGSSDPDGTPLTFAWTQTAGPEVDLSGADSSTATFPLPEVSGDTTFTFALVVDDGLASSPAASVSVVVTHVDLGPSVNAGADQTVEARTAVALWGYGSDPDGDPVTLAWTQTAGPTVTLTGADTNAPSFTAPSVSGPTVLTFSLVATANGVSSAADTVDITVVKVNRRPVAMGPNTFVEAERTAVVLSAALSSDPDQDSLAYRWTQTGGPVVALTGADTDSLGFTTPEVLTETKMSFLLTVTDPDGAESIPAMVELTVQDVNRAPTAAPRHLAGGIAKGEVTLDASASADVDGDTVSFAWSQTAGETVTLSATNAATVTFTAPESAQQLTFQLVVTDSKGMSATSDVQVEITEAQGCGGCASSGAGSSMLWGGLLLTVFLRRRKTA